MNKKLLVSALIAISTACSACNSIPVYKDVEFYSGNQYDENGHMLINTDLFYRNDPKIGGPDPFVFDNTERDGYYYIFSTLGVYICGRSKDLMNWEKIGSPLPVQVGSSSKLLNRVMNGYYWASEITYDPDTEKYYWFGSSNSIEGRSRYDCNGFVGVSDQPYGPFYIVNFSSTNTTPNVNEGTIGAGEGNLHTFNKADYPQMFCNYMLLNPSTLYEKVNASGVGIMKQGQFLTTIDFHPFIDTDGRKYLYFSAGLSGNVIFGVEMENWLKPKWDTFVPVMCSGYYTVEDKINNSPNIVNYETNHVNEGPVMVKHKNKYYLVYSNGNYEDSTYDLIQAISDSPLGPFKKLQEQQNAIIMSSQLEGSETVSGTGHNGMVFVDGELYNIYHKHRSFTIAGADRVAAVDKMKWITIKDENGEDMDVMYSNGPTNTLQPKIEKYSDYKNVAPLGKVSLVSGKLEEGSSLDYLTDDFLSLYKIDNDVTSTYVKETNLTETSTIRFDFDEPQDVRAFMVYNSKYEGRIFKNISKAQIEYEHDGSKGIVEFENIEFSKEFYREIEGFNTIIYVDPGAAAFAEFNEIKGVKSISLTIDLFEGSEEHLIGLSEIRILGRK